MYVDAPASCLHSNIHHVENWMILYMYIHTYIHTYIRTHTHIYTYDTSCTCKHLLLVSVEIDHVEVLRKFRDQLHACKDMYVCVRYVCVRV